MHTGHQTMSLSTTSLQTAIFGATLPLFQDLYQTCSSSDHQPRTFSCLVVQSAVSSVACAAVFLMARISYLKAYKGKTLPRGYTQFNKALPVQGREQECIRDSFKERKIPTDLDVIVIGSGISGLYLAASLARVGKKVLVLEQHYVAGGCTHVFEDKGWEFDTGLHYVGRGSKYGKLLELMSTGKDKADLVQLGSKANGYCYDEIYVADRPPHYYRRGQDVHIRDLVKRFPKYEKEITKYYELCVKVNASADPYVFGKLFSWLTKSLVYLFAADRFFKYASKTLSQVFDELHIDNLELRAILAGQFGDYGLPPSQASFFIHAGVVCHYMKEGKHEEPTFNTYI